MPVASYLLLSTNGRKQAGIQYVLQFSCGFRGSGKCLAAMDGIV